MKFGFICELDESDRRRPCKNRVPASLRCEVLDVSCSGYYARINRAESDRAKKGRQTHRDHHKYPRRSRRISCGFLTLRPFAPGRISRPLLMGIYAKWLAGRSIATCRPVWSPMPSGWRSIGNNRNRRCRHSFRPRQAIYEPRVPQPRARERHHSVSRNTGSCVGKAMAES